MTGRGMEQGVLSRADCLSSAVPADESQVGEPGLSKEDGAAGYIEIRGDRLEYGHSPEGLKPVRGELE